MKRALILLLAIALLGVSGVSLGQVATQCDTSQELDKYRFMRRASLDLRLKPPTWDEYQALNDVEWLPDSLLEEWLQGDEFLDSMRRMHADLLWPNPGGAQLGDVQTIIAHNKSTGIHAVSSAQRRQLYRLSPGLRWGNFPHGNAANSCHSAPFRDSLT